MIAPLAICPLAAWDAQGARVGVRAEPLARVCAGEQLVRIRSEFHDSLPLAISGPGAGPEVTAAGVLSGVIAAARDLRARASGASACVDHSAKVR